MSSNVLITVNELIHKQQNASLKGAELNRADLTKQILKQLRRRGAVSVSLKGKCSGRVNLLKPTTSPSTTVKCNLWWLHRSQRKWKGSFILFFCFDVLTYFKLSVFGGASSVRVDPLSRGTNNRSQFLLKTRICQLSVFYPFSGISFLAICSHCYLDREQSDLSSALQTN